MSLGARSGSLPTSEQRSVLRKHLSVTGLSGRRRRLRYVPVQPVHDTPVPDCHGIDLMVVDITGNPAVLMARGKRDDLKVDTGVAQLRDIRVPQFPQLPVIADPRFPAQRLETPACLLTPHDAAVRVREHQAVIVVERAQTETLITELGKISALRVISGISRSRRDRS